MDSIVTEKIREQAKIDKADDTQRFYPLAGYLLDYILSKDLPITVGIYGKWGSGKTVLANYMEDVADERNRENKDKESGNREIIFRHFDVVVYRESGKDLFWYFMAKIAEQGSLIEVMGESAKVAIAKTAQNVVKEKLGGDVAEILDSFVRSEKLKEDFANKIIKSYESKQCFIIIDNLDRLNPVDTINFLEQLKSFLLIKKDFKFAFLLLCDFDIISSEVQKIYNGKIDVRDYLNKIIEVPFYVPNFGIGQIDQLTNMLLNKELSPEMKEKVSATFKVSKLNTPRDVKNYLLELDMIFMIAKSRHEGESYLIDSLDKILSVQIIKTKYTKLYIFLKAKRDELVDTINLDRFRDFAYAYSKYEFQGRSIDSINFKVEDYFDNETVNSLVLVLSVLNGCNLIKSVGSERRLSSEIDKIFEILDTVSQTAIENLTLGMTYEIAGKDEK